MKKLRALVVSSLFALPFAALAGQQMCGRQVLPANARNCPDGSMPIYVADEVKPYRADEVKPYRADEVKPYRADEVMPYRADDARPARADDARASRAEPAPAKAGADRPAANPERLFGVWRTRIPGAVWTSPSGYQGYDWLHVSAGVSVGDLIIRPDGTYVWNSYGGKKGKWVKGDAEYPIVLIDTVENRRWRVGFDAKRTGGREIFVWDGNAYYYDGRR